MSYLKIFLVLAVSAAISIGGTYLWITYITGKGGSL